MSDGHGRRWHIVPDTYCQHPWASDGMCHALHGRHARSASRGHHPFCVVRSRHQRSTGSLIWVARRRCRTVRMLCTGQGSPVGASCLRAVTLASTKRLRPRRLDLCRQRPPLHLQPPGSGPSDVILRELHELPAVLPANLPVRVAVRVLQRVPRGIGAWRLHRRARPGH